MHINPHTLIRSATSIALPPTKPVLSISPIVIPIKDPPLPLEVRVTIPIDNSSSSPPPKNPLPVLLLSHGHGHSNYLSSLEGYAPLAEFYAALGFAVLQPTHLSSAHYALSYEPGDELHFKSRPGDLSALIDHLSIIESSLPTSLGIKLDPDKIAVAGHSLGAFTAYFLLGASNTDPRKTLNPTSSSKFTAFDPRIKAVVLLANTGSAGPNLSHLSDLGREKLIPFYDMSFEEMTSPTMVVYGDGDESPYLTTRGADWHGDAYTLSPAGRRKGEKSLLVLKGAKHGLGGISGWDAGETLDESPERLEIVRRVTFAWLWSRLYEEEGEEGEGVWEAAKKDLEGDEELRKMAVLETK
ncbi:alpha/beta-hydrolase [Rhypophila decipiens]